MPSVGRVFTENKCVMGGSQEYTSLIEVNDSAANNTGALVLGGNDSLDIVFDNDMILDDLRIRNVQSGVSFTVNLLFPGGGILPFGGPSTDFYMNVPGNNNNWYRIPKWARLRISIAEVPGNGVIHASIIGRA